MPSDSASRETARHERGRALFVRAGAFGDTLLLRSAVAAARARGLSVWLWAPRRWTVILERAGEIEGAFDWEGALTARALAGDTSALDLGGFDLVLAYTGHPDVVACLPDHAHVIQPAPPAGIHAAHWYARPLLAPNAGCPMPPLLRADPGDYPEVPTMHGERAEYVVLHPGSGSPVKSWPGFARLAERLGARLVVVRGPADEGASPDLDAHPNATVLRDATILEVAAALSRASAYVGNDSGITHLAAALGVPTVALFGPTDPAVWSPIGPRVACVQAPGGDWGQLDVGLITDALARVLALSKDAGGNSPAAPGAST